MRASGVELGDCGQRQHLVEQVAELLLAPARRQEVPEGAEAAALVGSAMASRSPMICSSSAPLLPSTARCARARRSKLAEVVLDLAEVGEQLACAHELLEAVLDRGVVEQRDVAGEHARAISASISSLALQLGDAPRPGSVSLPSPICLSSAKVSRRDSVPTNGARSAAPARRAPFRWPG